MKISDNNKKYQKIVHCQEGAFGRRKGIRSIPVAKETAGMVKANGIQGTENRRR